MDSNETYTFEDRTYVNPTLSRDEQMAFIDNLRSAQASAGQDIDTQTHNLGTDIVHNQGGLLIGTEPNSYWMSRYQTPQINAKAAALRSAAQASALNQVLQNEQKVWENRYNKAYQDLQKRQYGYSKKKNTTPTTTTPTTTTPTTTGNVNEDAVSSDGEVAVDWVASTNLGQDAGTYLSTVLTPEAVAGASPGEVGQYHNDGTKENLVARNKAYTTYGADLLHTLGISLPTGARISDSRDANVTTNVGRLYGLDWALAGLPAGVQLSDLVSSTNGGW